MKRAIFFVSLFLTILSLSSCRKQIDYTGEKKLDKLVIPANFTWETTKNITVTITSDVSRVITITSEDGNVRYHKGFFNLSSDNYVVSLRIPTLTESLRINNNVYTINGNSLDVSLLNNISFKTGTARAIPDGIVAYWRFDENAGTNAADAVGMNPGVLSGTTWATGVQNSALTFNGENSSVLVTSNSTLNHASNAISHSLWFSLANVGAGGAFMFHNTKYILRINSTGRITFALYLPLWKEILTDYADRIIDTDWHHLVTTYDGTEMKLYIDGVLKKSMAASGEVKSVNANLIIGSQSTSQFFKGSLDEVAIFGRALTQEEVLILKSENLNPGTGEESIISHWKFDESSGTTVIDSKGTNNGIGANISRTSGIIGGCLGFNGTSANVSIPHNASLNPSAELTLMAWAKTSENKTVKIAQKGDWDGYGLYQDKWSGWKAGIRLSNNTSVAIDWQNGVPLFGEWYHLAMTFDGVALKLYVNGQLKNSVAVALPLSLNTRPFSIGSDNAAQKFFNGWIDEVKLYSKALSQIEIQTAFQQSGDLADRDGDGINDEEDEYPDDPARAFNNFFPATGNGSLAFEDLWPGKGDYDFNDLVVDYRFTSVTNSTNKLSEIHGKFVVRANGAGLRNGFGFQLPGNVLQSDLEVSGFDLSENYIILNENGTEADQNHPTFILFDNIKTILQSNNGFGANVIQDLPYVQPDTIDIVIALKPDTYVLADLKPETFNPFLIVDMDRGKEIHLADYAPTALANTSFFGSVDDDSNPSNGRYYKTNSNLPWAINIAQSFDYTIEQAQISSGHLKFSEWAESGGTVFQDWYKNNSGNRNEAFIYQPNP